MDKLIKMNASGSEQKLRRGDNARLLTFCLVGALTLLACSSKLLLVAGQEQLTVESRQQKEASASENELADTIKYLEKLEKLDKYWSEVARPRFGRSGYKQQRGMSKLWLPQQAAGSLDGQRAQEQQLRQLSDPNFSRSILDFVNARMAQRYNSNAAY